MTPPQNLSLPNLLARLRLKGVDFGLSGGQLRYRGSLDALEAGEKNAVRSRREEILQFLRAREAAQRPPITRAKSMFPSFGQLLWWTWITSAPTPPPPQLIHVVKTFHGTSAAAVERAIRQLLVRYRNLRSRFRMVDNELAVELNDPETFVVEAEHLAPGDQMADRLQAFAARNMLVSDDWLVRAKLFTVENSDAVTAVVSVNHLLIDGPSQVLLSAELGKIHEAGSESPASPSVPEIEYFDYAEWERNWFYAHGKDLVDYWRQWCEALPALRNRSTGADIVWHPGRRMPYAFVLPPAMTQRVRRQAALLSSTRFLVYFTAFAIALARWSGQARFGIRSAGDGRMQDKLLQPVVGCMTMADPVEIDLDLSAPFGANLERIEREYRSAWQMRLPSLHAFAPYVVDPAADRGEPNKLAIQINYHPPGAVTEIPWKVEDDISQWPPALTKLEALTWTHPVLAIALDIMDREDEGAVGGYFRFNGTILAEEDCAGLMEEFFKVLSDQLA